VRGFEEMQDPPRAKELPILKQRMMFNLNLEDETKILSCLCKLQSIAICARRYVFHAAATTEEE
jgi:hypothetical protein